MSDNSSGHVMRAARRLAPVLASAASYLGPPESMQIGK